MICNNPSSGSRGLGRALNANSNSNYLVASNPSFGLSNSSIAFSNGNLVCSFVRDNTLTTSGAYIIANNAPVYLIAAYNNGGSYIFGSFYGKNIDKKYKSIWIHLIECFSKNKLA